MIRNLLVTGLTLLSLSTFAQYVPNSSQAFQFMSIYNPAFSGVDSYNDLRLGYRYQWAGLQGAPKAAVLSFNTTLRQPFDATSNALRLSNPNVEIPNKNLTIHGLGVNLFQETYGVFETVGGSVNYAMHYALSTKLRLSVGAGVVIENSNGNFNKIKFEQDEILLLNNYSKTDVSIRAGALIYANNFYFGLSYLPLWQPYVQLTTGFDNTSFYRGSAQMGFSFAMSPRVLLKPSVFAMVQTDNSINIDYNVKAFIGDKVWCGLSYRDVQSGVGLLGFNINNTFTVSYSYEMSLGKFKAFNDGSHDLVLAVKLNNFKKEHPYTW